VVLDAGVSSVEHARAMPSTFSPCHYIQPACQLENPAASNEDARGHINKSDKKSQEAASLLGHDQQDGFNVIFEEDAGHVVFRHWVGLGRGCILIREDGLAILLAGLVDDVRDPLGLLILDGDKVQGWRLWDGGRVKTTGSGGDAALGEDGGNDGEIVLKLVKVTRGGGYCLVERIEQ
jgi:hypothetical protein